MILSILIPQLIPLYLLIAMGFIGGRHLDVNLHSMAIVVIYFISPVVVFGAVAQMDFRPDYLILPLVLFTLSVIITTLSFHGAKQLFKDNIANLIGLSSATSNSGYFGLPLVIALFGADKSGLYILGNFGAEIVGITLAFYFGARGNFSVRESLLKLVKIPFIHAMALGLFWNLAIGDLPPIFLTYWGYFTGAWTIIGMMLIGVALGKLSSFRVNIRLTSWLCMVKFIVWPLAVGGAVALDQFYFHLFGMEVWALFILWSLCPLPNNVVAFAAQLNIRPDEAALTVLASNIVALFVLPAVLSLIHLV